MAFQHIRDMLRASDSMIGILPGGPVLGFDEIGKNFFVGPTLISQFRPMVKIHRLSAHIEMSTDGTRTSEDLASREEYFTSPDSFTFFRLITPVEAEVVKSLEKPCRRLDVRMFVRTSGFDEEDVQAWIFGKPVRQDTSCRTRPDDDVIKGFHRSR